MLLAFLFSDSSSGFFFIFPFFFVGDLGSFGFLFLAVSIAMIGVFICQMSRFTMHFDRTSPYVQTPIHHGECFICNARVPSDAEYCPKCGTRIDESLGDGQSQ